MEGGDDAALTSLCRAFWDALGRGNREEAERCLSELRPPEVVCETYSYSTTPSGGRGTEGGLPGASLFGVAPDTPKGDLQLWNTGRKVALVELDGKDMCLAKTSPKLGMRDFLACINWRPPAAKRRRQKERACNKMSHADAPGQDKVARIVLPPGQTAYAILVPISSERTHQRRCFSRPLFQVMNFPDPLRKLNRHEMLLGVEASPRAWKAVLQLYPGKKGMWDRHCANVSPGKPPAIELDRGGELLGDDFSEVREAPGL